VNFVISGLHNVQVFDGGMTPEDIGTNPPIIGSGLGGGMIDISENRISQAIPEPSVCFR
jgi:hypothetical protein